MYVSILSFIWQEVNVSFGLKLYAWPFHNYLRNYLVAKSNVLRNCVHLFGESWSVTSKSSSAGSPTVQVAQTTKNITEIINAAPTTFFQRVIRQATVSYRIYMHNNFKGRHYVFYFLKWIVIAWL